MDIRKEVETKDSNKISIQQVICGLTDQINNNIFTGAEIMGKSKQTLITFTESMGNQARAPVNHLACAVKMMVRDEDHHLIEDEQKTASCEKSKREQQEHKVYMSGILAK